MKRMKHLFACLMAIALVFGMVVQPTTKAVTYDPEITIHVTNVWDDARHESERPEYVDVVPYDGETPLTTVWLIEPDENGVWETDFTFLQSELVDENWQPKDTFTIREVNVPEGYQAVVEL